MLVLTKLWCNWNWGWQETGRHRTDPSRYQASLQYTYVLLVLDMLGDGGASHIRLRELPITLIYAGQNQ
jgi:hypothetical protein